MANVKKIDFRINEQTGCFECTSHKAGSHGYPAIRRGKIWTAHRYVYWKYVDSDIEGLDIGHICDNKICINPDHLEKVTRRKNLKDAYARGLRKKQNLKGKGAKISEQDVIDIYTSSEPGPVLAQKYNISVSAVSAIWTKQNWSHLTKDIHR